MAAAVAHQALPPGPPGAHFFENANQTSIGSAHFAGRDVHIQYNLGGPGNSAASADFRQHVEDMHERKKIAEWLSGTNYWNYHQDLSGRRTADTGTWFTHGDRYLRWKAGREGVLWVTGMPGAGKSILASFSIDDLYPSASNPRRAAVVFVYCRYMDKCTARGVLCTFLRQLLEAFPATVFRTISAAYDQHSMRQTTFTTRDAHYLLKELLTLFEAEEGVEAVIDGLDEIADDEKTELLEILSTMPTLKLLIFSRPLKLFVDLLEGLEVRDMTVRARSEDIELFLLSRIKSTPRLKKLLKDNEYLQEEVMDNIKRKSGGMFLMAALQLEAIRGCPNVKKLIEALNALPTGINNMYTATIERITSSHNENEDEAELALRALMWVTHSRYPLTMSELRGALATSWEDGTYDADAKSPPDLILSVCGGLLVMGNEGGVVSSPVYSTFDENYADNDTASDEDEEGDEDGWETESDQVSDGSIAESWSEVRLIHFTAQEHLTNLRTPPFSIAPAIIVMTCIAFLRHHDFTELTSSSLSTLEDFAQNAEWDEYRDFLTDIGGIGMYCHYHLGAHTRQLAQLYASVTSTNSNPVSTSNTGSKSRLSSMIRGRKVPQRSMSQAEREAEAKALIKEEAENALSSLADFLTDAENLFLEEVFFDRVDPFSYCASHGVIPLLPRLRHLHRTSLNGRTALQLAVLRGYTLNAEVVRTLLFDLDSEEEVEPIDVNAQDTNGATALHLACSSPPSETPFRKNRKPTGSIASSKASRARKDESEEEDDPDLAMVRLLLSHPDIDVNILDNDSKSAMCRAAEVGRRSVVDLLCAHPKINVKIPEEARDSSRYIYLATLIAVAQTPREELDEDDALGRSSSDIINLPTPYFGDTPLHLSLECVTSEERKLTMQFLLAQPKIKPNVLNCYGVSPLARAVEMGEEGVCELMLNHPGVDVNLANHRGTTALMLACSLYRTRIVEMFLDHPHIDVAKRNRKGESAFTIAHSLKFDRAVELLRPRISEADTEVLAPPPSTNADAALDSEDLVVDDDDDDDDMAWEDVLEKTFS